MKSFLLLLIITLLTSCGGTASRDVKFRAKGIWKSTTDYQWREYTGICIVDADSSFVVGDTIGVNSDVYVLQQRIK